jgi:hypothetical protein
MKSYALTYIIVHKAQADTPQTNKAKQQSCIKLGHQTITMHCVTRTSASALASS